MTKFIKECKVYYPMVYNDSDDLIKLNLIIK